MPGEAPPASARALLLCLHNHQPVGNFESVLEEATDRSYRPFLETLSDYPGIRVTLHYSGFLLRWLADRRPDTFSLLRDLVSRGQVEILGGGMYEPILSLLPERDRQGQIRRLAETVEECFGTRPRGIWLAERVWEPELPATLAAAGVEFLPLDDFHFLRAGLEAEELDGLYLTELNGATVRLFPGSERLRYLIPFGDVEETLRTVERMTSRDVPYPAAILADDGEKFGIWPGTHGSVYGEGWLRRFFSGIEARRDRLRTMTLGEYAAVAPLRGRVYLPSCSYIEMGEWALPAGKAAQFGALLREFRAGRGTELKAFAQGGTFRGFLRKYEEANQLHKRMLWVSGRVEEAEAKGDCAEGRDRLYRSQCNDPYWHGIFGGLYLNHLRDAAYVNLLRAEEAADRVLHAGEEGWAEWVRGDLDADGGEELLLKTAGLTLLFQGHDGGALTEISLPRRGVALGHVLTRREEGYHLQFRREGGGAAGHGSVHDRVALKDPAALDALGADPCQRASFREAFFPADAPLDGILGGRAGPLCTTTGAAEPCEAAREGDRAHVSLEVPLAGGGVHLSLRKSIAVDVREEGFLVGYRLANRGKEAVSGYLASEWNLNFVAGDGSDRRYEGIGDGGEPLSSRGIARGMARFRIVDGARGIAVAAEADREFLLLRHPVETASLSESGLERTHQGICLRLLFPVRLGPGAHEYYSLFWSVISVAS
jgi:4-alpha-glucanotransferase